MYLRSNQRRCSHEGLMLLAIIWRELYSIFRWYHSPNERKSDFFFVQLLSLIVYQSEETRLSIFIVLLFLFVSRSLYLLSTVRSRWERACDSYSKRVRHNIPQVTLHLIYQGLNSLISMSGSCGITLRIKLQKLENRAARDITFSDCDTAYIGYLLEMAQFNSLEWNW